MHCRNLQDAICSYLEYDNGSSVTLPEVKILEEDGKMVVDGGVIIVAGQMPSPLLLPPNTSFTKGWRIVNSGINTVNWTHKRIVE